MSHVWGTIPEREVHQGACVVPQFCSVLCVEEDEEPAPLVEKFTTRIQLLYLQLRVGMVIFHRSPCALTMVPRVFSPLGHIQNTYDHRWTLLWTRLLIQNVRFF